MAKYKFDDPDRDKVFEELGKTWDIKFSRIGQFKKFRMGSNGKYFSNQNQDLSISHKHTREWKNEYQGDFRIRIG